MTSTPMGGEETADGQDAGLPSDSAAGDSAGLQQLPFHAPDGTEAMDDHESMARDARGFDADTSWAGFRAVAQRGTGQEYIVTDGKDAYRIDRQNWTVTRAPRRWSEQGGWFAPHSEPDVAHIAAGMVRPEDG